MVKKIIEARFGQADDLTSGPKVDKEKDTVQTVLQALPIDSRIRVEAPIQAPKGDAEKLPRIETRATPTPSQLVAAKASESKPDEKIRKAETSLVASLSTNPEPLSETTPNAASELDTMTTPLSQFFPLVRRVRALEDAEEKRRVREVEEKKQQKQFEEQGRMRESVVKERLRQLEEEIEHKATTRMREQTRQLRINESMNSQLSELIYDYTALVPNILGYLKYSASTLPEVASRMSKVHNRLVKMQIRIDRLSGRMNRVDHETEWFPPKDVVVEKEAPIPDTTWMDNWSYDVRK
jgi:hypothetical protein